MPRDDRGIVNTLVSRMEEPRSFIQILPSPRQTGTSTAVLQALRKVSIPYVYSEVPQQDEQ